MRYGYGHCRFFQRSLCGHCTVTVRSLYGHCYFLAILHQVWVAMRRHVPAKVPRRDLASLAPATVLEVLPRSPRAGACAGAPCPKFCRRGSSAASVSQCGANDPDIYPGSPGAYFSTEVLSPHTAVDLPPQSVITRIQVGAARGDVYKTDDDNGHRQVSTLTFETTTAAT